MTVTKKMKYKFPINREVAVLIPILSAFCFWVVSIFATNYFLLGLMVIGSFVLYSFLLKRVSFSEDLIYLKDLTGFYERIWKVEHLQNVELSHVGLPPYRRTVLYLIFSTGKVEVNGIDKDVLYTFLSLTKKEIFLLI